MGVPDNPPDSGEREPNDLGTKPLDRFQLSQGSIIRHDNRARYPVPLRLPGKRLRHIPRANSIDPAPLRLRPQLRHHIADASDLERASGLKILQLKVNLGTIVQGQRNKRSSQHRTPNPGRRGFDLNYSNWLQRWNSEPP